MTVPSIFYSFLLATFLAVGAAVAILPGCADDSDRGFSDSDTGYDTGYDTGFKRAE